MIVGVSNPIIPPEPPPPAPDALGMFMGRPYPHHHLHRRRLFRDRGSIRVAGDEVHRATSVSARAFSITVSVLPGIPPGARTTAVAPLTAWPPAPLPGPAPLPPSPPFPVQAAAGATASSAGGCAERARCGSCACTDELRGCTMTTNVDQLTAVIESLAIRTSGLAPLARSVALTEIVVAAMTQ